MARYPIGADGRLMATFVGEDLSPEIAAVMVAEADGPPADGRQVWANGAWSWPVEAAADLAKDAIQAMIDERARERLYDSGVSIATYVASSNPAWAAEAQAFVAWRDAVWSYVYQQLALVAGGQRAMPSLAELMGELPPLTWPA